MPTLWWGLLCNPASRRQGGVGILVEQGKELLNLDIIGSFDRGFSIPP